MSEKSYTFIQKLSLGGNEVDIERVVSLSYTEMLDLSGPSIILEIRDEQSFIRDNYGLIAGSEIVMELGDVHGVGDQLFEETFIVSAYPVENDIITIEGFQKDCHNIKTPAGKPIFFVDKPPAVIIKALLPGLVVDSSINVRGTYHLNQGKTPARLLRDLARDNGAACWICRGTVYFKPLASLLTGTALLKMGLNSFDADINIQRYNYINNSALFERALHKSYSAWTTNARHKHSSTHKDKQSVLLGYPVTPQQLNNQSLYVQPLIDVVTLGDSRFTPGVIFDLEIVKLSSDAAIDESVDKQLFINTITHYTKGSKYNNRMVLGASNGT